MDHWDPRSPRKDDHAYQRKLSEKNPYSGFEGGGADRVRTDDLRLARAALSQLSYSPPACGGPR
jgi:hypothetical protein